ncbi:zinc finger CCCH domain-containing protein 48 [Ricinus communis]|uniref:F-box and wd40 domain protein, putative n=1 Tax=Ricinus communis TaxID=3988 RepID=B9RDG7_RICCO|nr:zinc finger CCCH domain-containing protein 48 [Ricinus communis]EEF50425.1 F-box and wd40 domain protein, putative [Ricinus communis]|eukprot:XP_015584570.1 zinc finger CCCH domain-containing protein 48 [Ricinus communis]
MDAQITTRTNHRVFGQRPATSRNSVCRFWKAGKCNRNPCRFLHRDLLPANNNVYLRTPKQSNTSLDEQQRRPVNNVPKSSLALCNGLENQCTQKIPNHVNHTDVPKTCSKRKTYLVSTTEDDGTEDRKIKKPSKAQKISIPATEDVPMKHPETKTSLDSTTEGNEDKRISSVTIIEGDASEKNDTSLVSDTKGDAAEDKETCLVSTTEGAALEDKSEVGIRRPCMDWMCGTCVKGDECQFLHKWYFGDWFSMLARLGEHDQAVSGITLPPRCDKLFSASSDGTVHVWDCHTGETTRVISLGDEIGSLISEGPWTFIGLPNVIKAWNLQSGTDLSLDAHGPFGQVYAMAVTEDTLFAGAQDGSILVWRGSTESPMPFQLATSLNAHTGAVICLIVGNGEKRLYSGSTDGTIRAWDVDTLQCVHTLNEHADAVTSLICWDNYLLSCSLDRTIKVWACTAEGNLEVIYTHNLEHGAVTLCGLSDLEAKPVLCCSCNDNSVCLFDLPSFSERGRIFSKQEVRTIQTGPNGLFFTGDEAGLVTVWRLTESYGSFP